MTDSQNNPTGKQTGPTNVQEETHFEDEIDLIDYFKVIWKRKWFILLGSVLPALIVGLILFFSPRMYKVTYTYDVKDQSIYDLKDRSSIDVSNWNLNEKNYNVLLTTFYSTDNIIKIVNKLQKNGLDRYAELINRTREMEDLKKFVDFKVLPLFIDSSKAKIIGAAELEQIGQLKAQLLKLNIIGRPKNSIPKISSVIRDNFENIIPLYLIEEQLNASTRECRAMMADIEKNRFNLELDLKTNESILAKLKDIKAGPPAKTKGKITVQFDVGNRSEYLPVEYQIQAAKSKAIQLEEKIATNEKKYNYYGDLLTLNEKLFAELNNKMSSYYTIQQFRSFLTDSVDNCNSRELKDYLNSYIKKIENRISASAPVTEKPKIYAISKGTAKKSAIVFAISLMISVFAAFLLEGLEKSQTRVS